MDLSPAMERMWIDEVLHLHALWRIGPPRHNTDINDRLSVANTTSFKREERRRRKAEKKQQERDLRQHHQQNVIPWPCPPSSTDEVRGWDEVCNEGHPAIPKPLSDEERVKVVALQAQKDCIKLCIDFFSKQCSSDNDQDEEEEGLMEEGVEEEMHESGGEIYFKFFMGIFEKDTDLRAYYEKNSENGEFFCLVCEGVREKVGRKFKDCVSLVQHSISIIKTKRRVAHRSFSRVVCRILGWNLERLHSVVLDVGDLHGQSLVNTANSPQQEDLQKSVISTRREFADIMVLDEAKECDQVDCFPDLKKEHEDVIVVDSKKSHSPKSQIMLML